MYNMLKCRYDDFIEILMSFPGWIGATETRQVRDEEGQGAGPSNPRR